MLKEMAWQGRSGGLDVATDVNQSVDYGAVTAIRDVLKKKKFNSRTALPPLQDGSNISVSTPAIFMIIIITVH
jgi:hypothetical protein